VTDGNGISISMLRQYSLGKGNFHSQPKLATMPALLREIDAATPQFCV
jgi:hypothetical protein